MDSLVSGFEYAPDEGDTEDKLYSFVESYNTYSDAKESAEREIITIEHRLDKNNFWSHKIPKIMLDFGLVEKIIELIR